MSKTSRDLPPSRLAPQFVVRLPDEAFRTRLAESAASNGRSMNSEIVARLEQSYEAKAAEKDGEKFMQMVEHIQRNQEQATRHIVMIRDMLARGVVGMSQELAPAVRDEPEFDQIVNIAQFVLNDDQIALAKALSARIQGSSPEVVKSASEMLAASNISARKKKAAPGAE